MSLGVTACIALASAGGVDGSSFTANRAFPWLPLHLQGDSKVTGGAVAPAEMQIRAIAVIAKVLECFVISRIKTTLGPKRRLLKTAVEVTSGYTTSPNRGGVRELVGSSDS